MAKAKTAKRKPGRPRLDPYEQTAKDLGLPILTTADSPRAAKARAGRSPVPVIISEGESNPLPPPVEVPGVPLANSNDSNDPYNLDPMFQSEDGAPSSVNSSTEPKPGEPLSPEAEAMLSGEADGPGGPAELPAAAGLTVMLPSFSEADVRAHLEEIFEFLATFFQSEHWALTERQSKMLGGPTAQLLDGVWLKLSEKLPDLITSTPGAAAFLLACTIVVVPKAAQQLAVSRARKQGKATTARRAGGPAPVQPIRQPDPNDIPTVTGNDFMVTGD